MTDKVEDDPSLKDPARGYVAGFMFSKDLKSVALIQKTKPEWQNGKLNAIGGKVEFGEDHHTAQFREFKEETGVGHKDWHLFCTLGDIRGYRVKFFCAVTDNVYKVRSMEKEIVVIRNVDSLPGNIIPNLSWLIPMARTVATGQEWRAKSFNVEELP